MKKLKNREVMESNPKSHSRSVAEPWWFLCPQGSRPADFGVMILSSSISITEGDLLSSPGLAIQSYPPQVSTVGLVMAKAPPGDSLSHWIGEFF